MLEMRLKKHRSHSKYSWKKTVYQENAFKLISSSVNALVILPKNDEALTDFQQEEAVAKRCSVKEVFLEISQNLQENTCARVSFLMKLQVLGLQLY